MMNTFRLLISSPDGIYFDADAVKITIRGIEGDLAVMHGHTPFVTVLKPYDCIVETADCSEKTGHTDGGLLSVHDNTATLISESFKWIQN